MSPVNNATFYYTADAHQPTCRWKPGSHEYPVKTVTPLGCFNRTEFPVTNGQFFRMVP